MTRKPLVTVVDDALPKARFRRLARAITALGSERLRTSYQTTFWFELGARPTNLVDEAVLTVAPRVHPTQRIIGVEWWLSRMRTSNVKVDFHVDRDNALFDDTGRTERPVISSLLYVTPSVGGLLAVTREPANPRNPACAPDRRDFDLVEPRPNRFVFFDARCTHGVLDARNEIPLKRLPTEPGWRIGIAINFWHRRPRRVPTFGESRHYRALAIAESAR